jgi:hypothetical protein
MATQGGHSWQFIGAASPKGTMLKLGTVAGQCDIATAVTDLPCGVLLEDAAAGTSTPQNVAVGQVHGEIYKVVGSTTIAIGAVLGAAAAGEAVTITLSTTYAQEWVFGVALTAAGSGGTDIVEMLYGPHIAS